MNTIRAAAPRRKLDIIVLSMIGIFVLFISVNGVMLWVTIHYPEQLVSKSYYDDATQYGKIMDKERLSLATGWRLETLDKAAPGTVVFRITDAMGKPVPGLTGKVRAYRPSDSGLDRDLRVRENPDAPGVYIADFAQAKSGHWDLIVDMRRATDRLYETLSWTAP